LNPCIYDDYKLKYYQFSERTQNNFLVTVLSPFSCILYIKGGCYITRIFLKNHQPIENIGNAMVNVCNIECVIPI